MLRGNAVQVILSMDNIVKIYVKKNFTFNSSFLPEKQTHIHTYVFLDYAGLSFTFYPLLSIILKIFIFGRIIDQPIKLREPSYVRHLVWKQNNTALNLIDITTASSLRAISPS